MTTHRILVLVSLLLCSVVAHAQAVFFSDDNRSNAPLTSIFMDRHGDMYPRGSVGPADLPKYKSRPEETATLKALYREQFTNDPCDEHWLALLGASSCNREVDFDQAWKQAQKTLITQAAQAIVKDAGGRDIVLLIHGFNNTYGESSRWYTAVEEDIRAREPALGRTFAFVRLHWDGSKHWAGFPVWTYAQFGGPWVGLELRRVLSEVYRLAPATRLRVFTHSSGAFVMSNVLGDGSAPLQDMYEENEDYREWSAGRKGYDYLPATANMRVAMLIPAVPTTVLSHYYQSAEGGAPGDRLNGFLPERLILGLSRRDFAAGKFLFPCSIWGGACMAVLTHDACNNVLRDLNPKVGDKRLRVNDHRIFAVTFPYSWSTSTLGFWHEHAVVSYKSQEREWSMLINALLADNPGRPNGMDRCTKPADELKSWW